jgi:methyl-accepting chemotaxis protein
LISPWTNVFANSRIKTKLLLAFLGLSAIVAVSGGTGLFYVVRTASTLTFFSELTSPLLVNSLGLAANAQRVRATFLEGLNNDRPQSDISSDLSALEAVARKRLQELGRLSDQARISIPHAELDGLQEQFWQTLRQIVAANFEGRSARATLLDRLMQFETERRQLDLSARMLATQIETKMGEHEDKAKIQVQTETATVNSLGDLVSQTMNETFPLLQGMYKLMRESVRLQELAHGYANATEASVLSAIQHEVQTSLKTSSATIRRLGGRLHSDVEKAQATTMGQSLGRLENLLLDNNGIFVAQRARLDEELQIEGLKKTLGAVESGYVKLLAEVEQAVQAINRKANADSLQLANHAILIVGCVILLALLVSILFGCIFSGRIVAPLSRLTEAMKRLADGDHAVAVPDRERQDEIGRMALALQVFKDSAIQAKQLMQERRAEQLMRDQRGRRMAELCASHDRSVTGMLDALHFAAREMKVTSEAMADVVVRTGKQATTAARATENAAGNVQIVAAAAEELSSSVSNINYRVSHSAQIAHKAAEEAVRVDGMVQKLQGTAGEIGQVVQIIEQLAAQTNLLALNATIEAARAGQAGRGFAVVASEVKLLAGQTAQATTEISDRITAIQNATQQVAHAINGIRITINEMREISNDVATTMEAQGSATHNIAENTQQAALSTTDITRNTHAVSESLLVTGASATQALSAAVALAHQTDALKGEITKFLDDVRAA